MVVSRHIDMVLAGPHGYGVGEVEFGHDEVIL